MKWQNRLYVPFPTKRWPTTDCAPLNYALVDDRYQLTLTSGRFSVQCSTRWTLKKLTVLMLAILFGKLLFIIIVILNNDNIVIVSLNG